MRWPQLDLDLLMGLALAEADAAARRGDVPVGAVVAEVATGAVLAAAGNDRVGGADPTAHAEIVALRAAATVRGNWRLTGMVLVVTLEPCPMCAGAALASRLDGIVFGAADPKAGAAGSLYQLLDDPRLGHSCAVVGGVRADEAGRQLRKFFAARR